MKNAMTEQELIDANEALDYQHEEAAGHAEGRLAELGNAVMALIADAPVPDPLAFVPTDAAGVDWVLKKISAARAEAALIRENADRMARACERDADTLEWRFGSNLQAFARQELEGGKKRSIRLFHGVIGFRTKPAGVHVTDEAAAIAWAKENLPAAIAERLDKKALTETLLSTGEVTDWATLQPAEDVFYIKS